MMKYDDTDSISMDASDLHLEGALDEYNERVNALEPLGDSEDLMEAYVNRGCILSMMEYRTSAMDDLESAYMMISRLESSGVAVDAGTYVKTLFTLGSMTFDQDSDPAEFYMLAATRLNDVGEHSRHFDRRGIIRMCIEASEDLIDDECPEDASPWLSKGLSLTEGRNDSWSLNRRMQLLNLCAEASNESNDLQSAIGRYGDAIEIGTELMERGGLDDTEELVMSFVSKAECEEGIGLLDMFLADMGSAILLLEQLLEYNRLDDPEVLVSIHHDVASVLMKHGRIEEAEKHLLAAMRVGVDGVDEYIKMQVERR